MRRLAGIISASLILALPLAAGGEALSGDNGFTFKRLKVGAGLPGKRITVQIDPAEQARALAALPKVDPNGVEPPADTRAVLAGDDLPASSGRTPARSELYCDSPPRQLWEAGSSRRPCSFARRN